MEQILITVACGVIGGLMGWALFMGCQWIIKKIKSRTKATKWQGIHPDPIDRAGIKRLFGMSVSKDDVDRDQWDALRPGSKDLKDWIDARITGLSENMNLMRIQERQRLRKKLKAAHDRIEKLEEKIRKVYELFDADKRYEWFMQGKGCGGKTFAINEAVRMAKTMGKYNPDEIKLTKKDMKYVSNRPHTKNVSKLVRPKVVAKRKKK